MIRTILFLLFISYGLSGLAAFSTGVGNGAQVFQCPKGEYKVVLLDSYEAKKMGLTLDLGNDLTLRAMVELAISRLDQKDTFIANKLGEYAREIVRDLELYNRKPNARGKVLYLGEDVNSPLGDALQVSLPADCEQTTQVLVNQREPRFKLEYRYQMNKLLWLQMSKEDQAMTVLHEAWYRILIENGATNARSARYLTGLISSIEFESYSFAEYFEELKGTELNHYTIVPSSEIFKEESILFHLKDHVFETRGNEVCAPNFKVNVWIKETFRLHNMGQRYLSNLKFKNVCFKNSIITRLELYPKTVNSDITIRLPFYQLYIKKAVSDNPSIIFHENGKLSHFSGMQFSQLMEMYYVCNGKNSFEFRYGCEEGPYINHKTKIYDLEDIFFDLNDERPRDYFKR